MTALPLTIKQIDMPGRYDGIPADRYHSASLTKVPALGSSGAIALMQTAERDEAIGNAQHAIHQAEQLTARAEQAEAKPGMTLGVGDGSGQLFVHGDYDSIKAAQAIIFRAKRLAARVATLEAANGKLREMLGRAGGLLGQFYEHHGWTPVGREVIAIIGKATTPRDGGGNG